MKNDSLHQPVMVNEVIEALNIDRIAHLKEVRIVDATVGLGGHSIEFVKRGINVLGIDSDFNSLKIAENNLSKACPLSHIKHMGKCFTLIKGNFRNLKRISLENNFNWVDGILFDLGISSYQLNDLQRGFSFKYRESPLDLRIDKDSSAINGMDLLNALNPSQLIDLFRITLDYRRARDLSYAIVLARNKRKIEKVVDFLNIIDKTIFSKKSIDKATLPFLALRIAVNSELQNLRESLPQTLNILKSGGRCVVICFHSGEDAIVKNIFKQMEIRKMVKIFIKKPILPGISEININKRAKSAKLRYFEKI
ncbi:16S rRNA (cytosine(1402)-N(4))-methyltransferase [Candidatus Woesebacteria bacterium RBG_13_34_9]|uniref:Ribosomal RNA small subunit methyltransferase H n=1 Tax=Candidatus Woesebacteria bacterium RBG_13_34_9 TaxID=1802477 RepID=A0A1F7X1T7_9BACT|nr:MAG: 16S rRNA (cytosine(1402)-N(4))-methyltransferase [Candidatus Woesebacteria bacterium RBG_13_34_9]